MATTPLMSIEGVDFYPAETPSAPPGGTVEGVTQVQRKIARLWNAYGAEIHRQAVVADIPVEIALAVFAVEAGRGAYDEETGLVIIRFEPHVFERETGETLPGMRTQAARWSVLADAARINRRVAFESTSWGLGQVMGFNYGVTKYDSPEAMALGFQNSVAEQIAGFFGFIEHNNLAGAIRDRDWQAFSRTYNGPGNVPAYSGMLAEHWGAIGEMLRDGAVFYPVTGDVGSVHDTWDELDRVLGLFDDALKALRKWANKP